MYWIIKWWAFIFLRLYFRKTIVYGLENVPASGPLIVASNHPSAFLEASILATNLRRPIHFLVRGDMFNPKFQWLFDWTNQIPIYRQKDGIANLRKNSSSFDLTYKKLADGEAVLIFPEAKTVLEKKMRPIQRGTAHLAFGTIPYLKDEEKLMVIPVGVNFTEPRLPGTDVVVKFGVPFESQNATREDRVAIEEFTETLSDAMNPLIIQVEDANEKKYDVFASVYLRMLFENDPERDAQSDLNMIASFVENQQSNPVMNNAADILKTLKHLDIEEASYFPDLIVLNRVGLVMLTMIKILWLVSGGWIWRIIRMIIFRKISTKTFQGPTTIGIFMVVMPLVTMLLFIVFLITEIPVYFLLIWLLLMLLGTIVRPSLNVLWKILWFNPGVKSRLKKEILDIMTHLKLIINEDQPKKEVSGMS